MLKPKYVHGLNAEEGPKSVLHRLQENNLKVFPWDDLPPLPDDDTIVNWTWTIG